MKFRVQNLTVLCNLYIVFEPAVGQHLLLPGRNIGEFYTSKYKYIGLYSLIVIPPLAVFSVRFAWLFVLSIFMLFFQQFVPITGSVFFQHLLRVHFAFWGNVVQQAMVCRRRRKGRWISVIYTLFQRTFRRLQRVIVCWRSITLDY